MEILDELEELIDKDEVDDFEEYNIIFVPDEENVKDEIHE